MIIFQNNTVNCVTQPQNFSNLTIQQTNVEPSLSNPPSEPVINKTLEKTVNIVLFLY